MSSELSSHLTDIKKTKFFVSTWNNSRWRELFIFISHNSTLVISAHDGDFFEARTVDANSSKIEAVNSRVVHYKFGG